MGARLSTTLLLALGGSAGFAAQPNILLIVADDVGAEASSLYPLAGDSGAAAMPNIEKLAAQGLTFENAWVNPMCSPTRATIVSGLYGHHTGVLIAGDILAPETKTIWDYLGEESPAKYDMAVFGKWHLGGNGGEIKHVQSMRVPNFRGFLGAQISDYFNWTAWDGNTGTATPITTYSTTALTDWAIEFINKHKASRPQDPWFVYLPYNAATVPVYKAMMQAMDTEIGRLLKNVDLKNTVVIYLGDNGTPENVKDNGSKLHGSKTSVWEGGAKVPMTIAGAGITRTGREPALVNGTDLYATVAAVAGIPVKHVNDSYSLVPLFTDAKATTGRSYAFAEFCSAQIGSARHAIRDSRYKLLYDKATGWGLYNLQDDQAEADNLYDKPGYSAPQKKLQAELDKLKAGASKGCFI